MVGLCVQQWKEQTAIITLLKLALRIAALLLGFKTGERTLAAD